MKIQLIKKEIEKLPVEEQIGIKLWIEEHVQKEQEEIDNETKDIKFKDVYEDFT